MSDAAVRAVVTASGLCKHFRVVRRQRTALRALRALANPAERFAERTVLRDLDFTIAAGSKVALIGGNGCGKTTLLRIISGIYRQTSGELRVATAPRPLFSYTIGFVGELTVEDNVYLFGALHEMDRAFLAPRCDAVVEFAGLAGHRHTQLKQLSAGQRQRLALSVFFQSPAELLIFDEALSNVDHGFLGRCDDYFRRLAASERTLIFTAHDSSLLRRYCTSALWLDGGRMRSAGAVDDVLEEYDRSFAAGLG